MLTSIDPKGRPQLAFDAYEYTVQSHTYASGEVAGAVWRWPEKQAGAWGSGWLSNREALLRVLPYVLITLRRT